MTQPQSPRIFALVSGEDTDNGKSTLARQVLRPALKSLYGTCSYYLIERKDDANQRLPEGEDQRFGPEDTQDVLTACGRARARKQSAVVEVGGGQAEAFVSNVETYAGSENRIDRWILVIRPNQKADKVVETVNRFIALGVDVKKLVLLVNFVPQGRTAAEVISKDMPTVAAHAAEMGYRILANGVPSSDTIRKLRELPGYTIAGIASNDEDFTAKAEAAWAENTPEADVRADQLEKVARLQMGAKGVVGAIDAVTEELLAA